MKTHNSHAAESCSTIIETISAARRAVGTARVLAVADCIDVLLDCYNASDRPEVKAVVTAQLPYFTTGNLRRSEEFIRVLDQIQVAAWDSVTMCDQVQSSAPA